MNRATDIISSLHLFPTLASAAAVSIDTVVVYTLCVVLLFLITGHAVLVYCLFRFRNREKISRRLNGHTEAALGISVALLMALLAEGGNLVLARPVWERVYANDSARDPTVVEATGQQFQWIFRYPGKDQTFGKTDPHFISDDNLLGVEKGDPASKDDVVVQDELCVPVNRPVYLVLRSKDMIHSVNIPSFRVRQDAVPGMAIPVRFFPTQVGEFEVACSQICGLGHYTMRAIIKVVPTQNDLGVTI